MTNAQTIRKILEKKKLTFYQTEEAKINALFI